MWFGKAFLLAAIITIAGCNERSARAGVRNHHKRHQETTLNLSERMERDSAKRIADLAAEDARRRAQWDAENAARRSGVEKHSKAVEKLALAMYVFGLKRLPAVQASERQQKIYKRHLHNIAAMIVTVSEAHQPDLISEEQDPYLIAAITYHESSWAQRVIDGRQRGRRGEIGLMQLMPDGYCSYSMRDENGQRLDMLNVENNLRLGVACLTNLRERHHDPDIWQVLGRYASGKGWPAGRHASDEFKEIYEELSRPEVDS